MKLIVERFEGGFALCEDMETGGRITLAQSEIPKGVREGDVLIREGDGYAIDTAATEERRARMRSRFDRLKRKDKGDV